ncbi:MAG TPA: FHA domain-containing protein [Pyrinomonadaceae bacterium]|nr:FHA domain-containing protein [Pyrinomonadaceae bacterium]
MTELWLKFKDEKGEDRRVLVEGNKFVIGRHSENDLSIPNGKLSRQHVKIESFGEVFIVSDCGSSNGTTLNGADLRDPIALNDGDKLNLGGGLEIEIEIISDKPKAKQPVADDEDDDSDDEDFSAGSAGSGGQASAASASTGSSIPTGVLIAAPVLVIVFLLCGGGAILFFGGNSANNSRSNNDIGSYYPTPDETPERTRESTSPKTSSTVGSGTTTSPSPDETAAPEVSDEKKKIEQNSASFLQRIALNDPSAFLKTSQIDLVSSKISQFKGSGNLAENLKAVKSNAAQFQTLAQSKGLKPLFLATAALAEIGNNRGNPLETAQRMLPVFSELRISLANNLADDNLMMIAAYDQGKAGKFKDLRNSLEALAKKNPSVSPREIRTIWFLKQQGKITDAEFEFALRFLAIGTITQNPKDFNVNAEAVIFN